MVIGLFFFGANIVALTANLLTGAGLLVSSPRSFNVRVFAGVTVSAACYLVGRLSYAVPADVQVTFYLWPFLLTFMNLGSGFWMILAYSLFQDERRIPRWLIAAFALQALLSTVNAFGYVGRDDSVLLSDAYPPIVNFVFGPLPLAMQTTFAVLALYWTARGWRADLDESRRLLRGLFLAVVGGLKFGVSATELYLLDAPYSSRAPFDNAVTVVMASAYVVLALTVLRFDHRVLERLLERTKPSPDPKTDAEFRSRLRQAHSGAERREGVSHARPLDRCARETVDHARVPAAGVDQQAARLPELQRVAARAPATRGVRAARRPR